MDGSNLENGNTITPRISEEHKLPSTEQSNGKSNSQQQQDTQAQQQQAQQQPRLNLTMSAKELRAKLAMRKKYDPKKESIGFKDKFDIVQKL